MNADPEYRARVLIVDDNPHIIDLFSDFLSGAGYAVLAASDGIGALRKIEEESPDVVLLDIILPEINGMEVLRRMGPIADQVPVIMITGHQDETIAMETLRAGAFDYIANPFDVVHLAHTVAAAVVYRNMG